MESDCLKIIFRTSKDHPSYEKRFIIFALMEFLAGLNESQRVAVENIEGPTNLGKIARFVFHTTPI
jgi:hypothetical protein